VFLAASIIDQILVPHLAENKSINELIHSHPSFHVDITLTSAFANDFAFSKSTISDNFTSNCFTINHNDSTVNSFRASAICVLFLASAVPI
jgi:hypothetical protein